MKTITSNNEKLQLNVNYEIIECGVYIKVNRYVAEIGTKIISAFTLKCLQNQVSQFDFEKDSLRNIDVDMITEFGINH